MPEDPPPIIRPMRFSIRGWLRSLFSDAGKGGRNRTFAFSERPPPPTPTRPRKLRVEADMSGLFLARRPLVLRCPIDDEATATKVVISALKDYPQSALDLAHKLDGAVEYANIRQILRRQANVGTIRKVRRGLYCAAA